MTASRNPMFCGTCGAPISSQARFCTACGAAAGSDAAAADATLSGDAPDIEGATFAPQTPAPRKASSSQLATRPPKLPQKNRPLSSSDPISGGRFASGQMIAERYRVVALAGRGGMGEVYRAEDLRLGQLVAIKFLPQELSEDVAALARFHSEVRIARQVSHPNVCRVFDIGDVEGIPFLSMEYVDGEDLASVVRRIGRLSQDKATEVARQICAGLAAAHDRGVIHRDLKPANVMLDGAGKVRVMDFGLAGIAATIHGAEIRAGTPAYMAPEQLAGKEVTAKSDIYSLGLILYEITTGKRAFEASTVPELIRLRDEGQITQPSTLVRDLDPLLERVILRCLDKDPSQRPASALQVAAALPGGDPLAAALAAGETPSPEMVAASGAKEGLRPGIAVAMLAAVFIGLLFAIFIADRYKLNNRTPLENPPEVLSARAREIIRNLGYSSPQADAASGFEIDGSYLDFIERHDKSLSRWDVLSEERPASLHFWYRESPRELKAFNFYSSGGAGEITSFDPAMNVSNMTAVTLDTAGHLIHFEAVPPQLNTPAASVLAPDWQPLFSAAGLQLSDFKSVAPEWTPLAWGDARAAWQRTLPGPRNISERVEAASYLGKPIYFDLVYPWDKPARSEPYQQTVREKITTLILVTLFVGLITASIFVVRRNLRLNRGDTRGAVRLAIFVFLAFMIAWALRAHHIASPDEFDGLFIAFAWGCLLTAMASLLYLALEPYVRKNAPQTLVSWSRLIAGDLHDPLVGRDLLIGAVYGVWLTLFETSDDFLLPLFGKTPPPPGSLAPNTLTGVAHTLGYIPHFTLIFVLYGLFVFFLFFIARLLVRKDWIAAAIIVILGAITNNGADHPYFTLFAAAIVWLSIIWVLRRYGLVALVVGLVVQNVLIVFPVTSHLSRWYASPGLTGIAAIAVLAIYGFRTALAGQPLLSGAVLDK
jgi:serine/threonine protein kinase